MKINKKYLKILIAFIIFCFLGTVFFYFSKNSSQIVALPLSGENIKVSLVVQDKIYYIETRDNSTVFDLMLKIKEGNNEFDFKYKEYSGLGIFVNEINGLKGGSDGNWIYYVKDEEASVGVSNYKVKEGDIISWKYEK